MREKRAESHQKVSDLDGMVIALERITIPIYYARAISRKKPSTVDKKKGEI